MDNVYIKAAKSMGKIALLSALAYLFVLIFYAPNKVQLGVGLFMLFFVTLPTFYWMFFKTKFPKLAKIWKVYRYFYIFFIVLYLAFFSLGIARLADKQKTQKAIDFINSRRITLDDVMGKNLPPKPDQQLNDSTIAGIDANNNYIRDDVELAIFQKYPDNAKIRAAMLQYAQALQLELTRTSSGVSILLILIKKTNASNCIDDAIENTKDGDSEEEYIQNITTNIKIRIERLSNIGEEYKKDGDKLYMSLVAYVMSPDQKRCDIEVK